MQRWRGWLALFVVGFLALTPSLAAARAGGSYRGGGGGSFTSQGSRGMYGGQGMERSTAPSSPGYGSNYGSGFGASHPFLTGLAGGLFGSWIGSLLFPHWGYGSGGMGSAFGSLFTWLVIIGLVWFGFRALSRGWGSSVTAPPLGGGLGGMGFAGMGGFAAPQPRGAPLAVNQADYQAFETNLKQVQEAWSRGDIGAMRHLMTPEMQSYFSEELAGNESQGVTNHVEQVQLLKGDLREAWDEGHLHFATCLLHWRALDYTVRSADGAVVDGDRQQSSEAAELWTFARSPGGHWILSAIQQV